MILAKRPRSDNLINTWRKSIRFQYFFMILTNSSKAFSLIDFFSLSLVKSISLCVIDINSNFGTNLSQWNITKKWVNHQKQIQHFFHKYQWHLEDCTPNFSTRKKEWMRECESVLTLKESVKRWCVQFLRCVLLSTNTRTFLACFSLHSYYCKLFNKSRM